MTRFKQFASASIDLQPSGITLLAGGNNAGKSSLLHALAVWEFCRTATLMERGEEAIHAATFQRQGFGLGDDEFSPINVPSLKHLWTNLKTQKTDLDADGYTLRIGCEWRHPGDGAARLLEFGLSLANDRLFVRTTRSTVEPGDPVPVVAYLPPFAGIAAHEERTRGAIRRRRIGEGLAGAILRNLLLDMHQENQARRRELRGTRQKISDADLRRLREEDPWEQLSAALREVFSAELEIADFREDYHSYVKVQIAKGTVNGYKLKRFPNFTPRDLMVEGSGFLQWLSVYTLAVTPGLTTLLYDEPDAHLHSTLQTQLLNQLAAVAGKAGRQILLATHSTEILRAAHSEDILVVQRGKPAKYLKEDSQKIGLLAGLGSDYSPRIESARRSGRLLFVEGKTDLPVLKAVAKVLGVEWPGRWTEWTSAMHHKERKHLYLAFTAEFPNPLTVLSLRDRDDEALATVAEDLHDRVHPDEGLFLTRKWRRRHIESYLVCPRAIAEVSGQTVEAVVEDLRDKFGVAVGDTFIASDAPQALLDLRGKDVLRHFGVSSADVAKALRPEEVCEDLKTLVDELISLERDTGS